MTPLQPTPAPQAPAPLLPPILLSSRLVATGILSAGLALLTVVLALTGMDYWSTRSSMLQDSRVEAAIVADNISAAVMFRDTGTANEMLGALRSSSMVLAAGVYDNDGVLFAHYARDRDPEFPTTLRATGMNGALERSGWERLEIVRAIPGAAGMATPLGTLYIRKSMREVHSRLALRFGSALLVAVCAMGVATAMVLRSRAAVREAEHRLHTLATPMPSRAPATAMRSTSGWPPSWNRPATWGTAWRWSTSTWTTSRPSTTPSATLRATACCARWRSACSRWCAATTPSRAWGATSLR